MLVDDHAVVRQGLRQIFEACCTDIVVACEAATGTEAIELVRSRPLDAVLLDLSLPDRSGIDVLRRLRCERVDLPVLVVSLHDERHYALNVMKAGARGYVCKSSASHEIVEATRTVLGGKRYISPSVAEQMLTVYSSDGNNRAPHERLSTREFEVFCKLASGTATAAIARELFLTVKTVQTHRAHVLAKLGFKTSADLTYYAIKSGLIK